VQAAWLLLVRVFCLLRVLVHLQFLCSCSSSILVEISHTTWKTEQTRMDFPLSDVSALRSGVFYLQLVMYPAFTYVSASISSDRAPSGLSRNPLSPYLGILLVFLGWLRYTNVSYVSNVVAGVK
jgi:hypothetical protein